MVKDRREMQIVRDKKVEVGISLSVVLQAGMIAVMIWVGTSIKEGNRLLENHNVRIDVLEKVLDSHIDDYKKTVLFPSSKG